MVEGQSFAESRAASFAQEAACCFAYLGMARKSLCFTEALSHGAASLDPPKGHQTHDGVTLI